MNIPGLRNHIPLGAPATREPCDGSESSMRVSLGFTPRWFRDRLGIDFSESWHQDADVRFHSLTAMKAHLHECFPEVPFFVPSGDPDPSCVTISGVYGIMLISGLFGLELDYRVDDWPDAAGGRKLSKDEISATPVPLPNGDYDVFLDQHKLYIDLMKQMDRLEEKFGIIPGYLNYQGILNVAMKLGGQDIFLDLYDDPEFTRIFFRRIAGLIGAVSKRIQARQRSSGFHINLLSMSNCVINMLRPEQYAEFLLPLDQALSREYKRFGIHTCNWDASPYAEYLTGIENMGYFDTGPAADLAGIRSLFPETRRAVLYSPVWLVEKNENEIAADLERIARDFAPCDVVLADENVLSGRSDR
ncbi:MAG: hypothetical protein P1P77_00925 [Spirochaetaceae bacterium]|nr:hypothetical protein [Spirochaetaceae bacterium]